MSQAGGLACPEVLEGSKRLVQHLCHTEPERQSARISRSVSPTGGRISRSVSARVRGLACPEVLEGSKRFNAIHFITTIKSNDIRAQKDFD